LPQSTLTFPIGNLCQFSIRGATAVAYLSRERDEAPRPAMARRVAQVAEARKKIADDDTVTIAIHPAPTPHAIGEPTIWIDIPQRAIVKLMRRNQGTIRSEGPGRIGRFLKNDKATHLRSIAVTLYSFLAPKAAR
jgi:hypothetical protein